MAEAGERLFEELMRFRPDGLTANGWAVKAGVARTIWSDLRRHGNPSRRTLEKLLGAAGMTLAEFEALRVEDSSPEGAAGGLAEPGHSWRGATPTPLSLFITRLAGEWVEAGSGIAFHSIDRSVAVGQVERPSALAADPDAYAMILAGEAMWPRFRAGRRLLVSPAAAVTVGDDVLVQLKDCRAFINELVSQTARRIELRQFNPDVAFKVETSEVRALHKIMGEAI
jgi:hypothetical protein